MFAAGGSVKRPLERYKFSIARSFMSSVFNYLGNLLVMNRLGHCSHSFNNPYTALWWMPSSSMTP